MGLKSHILVLEDEPLIRLMLLGGLEDAGFTVDVANTCAEALRMARSGAFSAAIFDLRLPDGASTDVVHTLRKHGNHLPVMILSAEASAVPAKTIDDLMLVAVLSKPPVMSDVLTELNLALCRTEEASHPVTFAGEYRIWNATTGDLGLFENLDSSTRIVIDCSDIGSDSLDDSVEKFVRTAKDRAALFGAGKTLQLRMKAKNDALICVEQLDELVALARRTSSPSERTALLRSVVHRT